MLNRSFSKTETALQLQFTNALTALEAKFQNKTVSFFNIYFDDNVAPTLLTQNIWARFANITNPWVLVINSGSDFTSVPNELKITYTGIVPKVFELSAVINIFKASGNSQTRTLELQWRLNNNPIGVIRQAQSNNEANIYTGNGVLLLNPNDFIEPFVRNIENNDDVRCDNASFIIQEVITSRVVYTP